VALSKGKKETWSPVKVVSQLEGIAGVLAKIALKNEWNNYHGFSLDSLKNVFLGNQIPSSTETLTHNDIASANILSNSSNGEPCRLIDWNAASSIEGSAFAGRFRYMSPERAISEKVSPQGDVFSFAIVCLELMTGKGLYEPKSVNIELAQEILHYEELGFTSYGDVVSRLRNYAVEHELDQDCLIDVMQKALHPDPAKRYAHAGVFFAELRSVFENSS
jgi:serine/threonine protein kinase